MRSSIRLCAMLSALILPICSPLYAEEVPEFTLSLQGDVFSPAEIRAPANKAFTLRFQNKEASAVELESKALKIEKIVPPNGVVSLRVKPQAPGRYPFVNEYREDAAKGVIIVE